MKICTTCRTDKPGDAFGRDKRNRDGLQSRCRDCDAARWRTKRADLAESRLDSTDYYPPPPAGLTMSDWLENAARRLAHV